jgi:hypothetical protein
MNIEVEPCCGLPRLKNPEDYDATYRVNGMYVRLVGTHQKAGFSRRSQMLTQCVIDCKTGVYYDILWVEFWRNWESFRMNDMETIAASALSPPEG